MTNDLLPCPFCGGSAHYNFTDAGADRKYYRVHCSKCDARIGHPYTGKDAAATVWNTRTTSAPQSDMVAVPREVIEKIVYALDRAAQFKTNDTQTQLEKDCLSMLQPYTKGE